MFLQWENLRVVQLSSMCHHAEFVIVRTLVSREFSSGRGKISVLNYDEDKLSAFLRTVQVLRKGYTNFKVPCKSYGFFAFDEEPLWNCFKLFSHFSMHNTSETTTFASWRNLLMEIMHFL